MRTASRTSRTLLALLWLCAGLLGSAAPGAAQDSPAGKSIRVKASGCGTVLGGDTARAEDEAVVAARRRALEKAFGVHVDAETVVRNTALFDSLVRNKVYGFVKNYEKLSEEKQGGQVCVEIEAWVLPQKIKERLPEMVSEVSVIVRLPETICDRPRKVRIVENNITRKLVRAGYKVLDAKQLARVSERDVKLALHKGDREAANRLRFKFLTNILVGGEAIAEFSQNNSGIISAIAQVETRAVVADSAQILASYITEDGRGFSKSCKGAGRRALKTEGRKAADEVLQALDKHLRQKEREIEVRIWGIPHVNVYRRFKNLVQTERWVSSVKEGKYSREVSTYIVRYPEKTIYLATSLARKSEVKLKLEEFGWTRIVLRYSP